MRVLWISGNSAMYKDDHLNGGWIASLQSEITKIDGISLGIAFHFNENAEKEIKDGVTYYPVLFQSPKIKFLRLLSQKKADEYILNGFIEAVNDFHPDIIHVWGSEMEFGLIAKYTDVPVVLHIQGLLSPIYNLRFPNDVSLSRLLLLNISLSKKYHLIRSNMHKCAKREREIMHNVKYVIGRTDWDNACSMAINPERQYFYCSEMLRLPFLEASKWFYRDGDKKIVVTSVVNDSMYKGVDVILRSCKVMKDLGIDFVWKVIGCNDFSIFQKKTEIYHNEVNVENLGRQNADQIIEHMLSSDMFIHLSYIENSPNCVCEAQILGVPVIATSVGGTPTLIENNRTGILVSTNDPYNVVGKILYLKNNKSICQSISKSSVIAAEQRHSKDSIVKDLISCYNTILNS